MKNIDEIKTAFNKLYKTLNQYKPFSNLLPSLFDDLDSSIKDFRKAFNEALSEDAKAALEMNRAYFDVVQLQNETCQETIDKNHQLLSDNAMQDDRKKQHYFQADSINKAKTKLILSNAEVDAQSKILKAQDKVNKLIVETNKEIDIIKENYLVESDKLIKERDIKLAQLADKYQVLLDETRLKITDREAVYEQQISKLRSIREQYVLYSSEAYKRIKDSHNNFSIYYNDQIDRLSQTYRDQIKRENDLNQEQIATVQSKINKIKEEIVSRDYETKLEIEKYSDELKEQFNNIKNEYDEELRLIVFNQNNSINHLNAEFERYQEDLKKQLAFFKKNYENGYKTKHDKKQYLAHSNDLKSQMQLNKEATSYKIKELKSKNNVLINQSKINFQKTKHELDSKFLEYEFEKTIAKEVFVMEKQEQIDLLNLQMEVYEEEKNKEIAKLNDAYAKEIAYFERILAIGSINQELLIQDQVGENSYLLADNLYQNEIVKSSFDQDIEAINLEIKNHKIRQQENIQKVTSYYQLLIQKEMVKRDSLVKQYEYEILIAKENLKKQRYEHVYEYDSVKLRSEFELNTELKNNENNIHQLDYYLNLRKLKLENVTSKREANLQIQILKAKAQRNYAMHKIEVEKNDRFYLGFIDLLFIYQSKQDKINQLILSSYDQPDFSMTEFYHLLSLLKGLNSAIKDEFVDLINEFYLESDDYFYRKIEELTGYRYYNKLQELLNNHNQSEELINNEIDNIQKDRLSIETSLNNLDAIKHKDNIQISNLYRNIKIFKTKKSSSKTDERIVRLESEIAHIQNQIKINERTSRQYERQLKFKENELKPLYKRLYNLNKTHENEKRILNIQINRDARIFHRQRQKNKGLFDKITTYLNMNIELFNKNLSNLHINLDKSIKAIDNYQKEFLKNRLKLSNHLINKLSDFREVLFNIYESQINEQKHVVDNFNLSYATLIKNLNANYLSSYSSEKRKNELNLKNHKIAQDRLHTEFFNETEKLNKTLLSRIIKVNNKLEEYDSLFQETYHIKEKTLVVIDNNLDELLNELETQSNNLIFLATKEYDDYSNKLSSEKRLKTNNLSKLFNDTMQRSNQYREQYLYDKDEIIDSLRIWNIENKTNARRRYQEYKETIQELKLREVYIKRDSKNNIVKNNFKLKRNYMKKLKEIEISL